MNLSSTLPSTIAIKHRCLKNESLLMFIDRPSYNNDDHIKWYINGNINSKVINAIWCVVGATHKRCSSNPNAMWYVIDATFFKEILGTLFWLDFLILLTKAS
jgi:hypothetical protein